MKRKLGEEGFTLIEMMIVLLIISVLILIAIPNVTKHSSTIDKRGCEAFIKMIEGQVEAYKIDFKETPTIAKLHEKEFIKGEKVEGAQDVKLYCPNGNELEITNGEVKEIKRKENEDNT